MLRTQENSSSRYVRKNDRPVMRLLPHSCETSRQPDIAGLKTHWEPRVRREAAKKNARENWLKKEGRAGQKTGQTPGWIRAEQDEAGTGTTFVFIRTAQAQRRPRPATRPRIADAHRQRNRAARSQARHNRHSVHPQHPLKSTSHALLFLSWVRRCGRVTCAFRPCQGQIYRV